MAERTDWSAAPVQPNNGNLGAAESHARRAEITDQCWQLTKDRAFIIQMIVHIPPSKRAEAVRVAALQLRLSRATIYRDLSKFNGRVSDLVPSAPGMPRGTSKLHAEVREIITRIIDTEYLKPQKPSFSSVVKTIRRECTEKLLPPPAYSSVQRQLSRYDRVVLARRRGEHDRARALTLTPGSYDVRVPMAVWQIDHTLVDVIVVSELERRPIGRVWLTLIIDVATRMIAGFYVTLEAPSSHTVARALAHAVAPKEEYLAQLGLEGRWPVFGKPFALHSDNGSEFAKAIAYRRGCEDRFIEVILRPPGSPHYGGHIERLIGSMMALAKLLPGATFSNPKQRGSYNSDKTATLSVYEVERWMAQQVLDYHDRRHSSLGRSPLDAWDALCVERHAHPEPIADPDDFYRDFLPTRTARIGRKGIVFRTLEYSGEVIGRLRRAGAESVEFRHDPMDLSRVFVRDGSRYHEAKLNYPGEPIVTAWEVQAELARRRKAGEGPSNCALTVAGILRQREALLERDRPTRGGLRKVERLRTHGIPMTMDSDLPRSGSNWRAIMGDGGHHV